MNKYLTKAAQISTLTLQKVHGDSSISKPDLTKKAFEFKEHAKELRDTGIIAGLGGVGNMLSAKLLKQHNAFSPKTFAVGTGVGLLADYAGIKINKGLNGAPKKETNVPL